MGDRCCITRGGSCLLSLLLGFEAGPALGGSQPCSLAILLADKAGQVMDLLVTAGVEDELFHSGMVAHCR